MPGVAQRYWSASTLQGRRWLMEKRLEAVDQNDLAQLRQLLDAQGRLKPRELTAALEIAVMKRSDKYAECVQLLLQRGANPDGANGSGTHFIHLAADADCHQVVALLVQHKCDVNIGREDGARALHKAAWQGSVSSLQVLLQAGCDMTAVDAMGRTPILAAAHANRSDVVALLLRANCSVNVCDNLGRSVLYWAVYHRNAAMVSTVLPQCSRTVIDTADPEGVTPLILAAHSGRDDIMRLLLDTGCYTDTREEHGMTALVVAARQDHRRCVQTLVEAGCDVDAQDDYGKTALMLLLDDARLTQLLLQAGADPNQHGTNQPSPLCLAAKHGFTTSTKLLIQYNARVDVSCEGNKLPLHIAAYSGSLSLAKMLLVASIAMATDLTWLSDYLKDENFRGEAATNPSVAETVRWIADVFDDFYRPHDALSLKSMCRVLLRCQLGSIQLWSRIDDLRLPEPLKDYLKLRELDNYDNL